jgi:hypothetical protein
MRRAHRFVVNASGALPAILLMLTVESAAQKKDRTVLLMKSPKHFVTVVRANVAARMFGLTP